MEILKIASRDFEFRVTGANTRQENIAVIEDFQKHLLANYGIDTYGDCFADGEWVKDDKLSHIYLLIHVENIDEKQVIESAYKEWKLK